MGDKNNNIYYQGEVKREYILFGDYILEGLGSKTFPDGDKYVGECVLVQRELEFSMF